MGIVTVVVASSSPSWWQTTLIGFGGAFVGALGAVVGSFAVSRHDRTQLHRIRQMELVPKLAGWFYKVGASGLLADTQAIDMDELASIADEIMTEAIVAGRRDARHCHGMHDPLRSLDAAEQQLRRLMDTGRPSDDNEATDQVQRRSDAFDTAYKGSIEYVEWLEARFGVRGGPLNLRLGGRGHSLPPITLRSRRGSPNPTAAEPPPGRSTQ